MKQNKWPTIQLIVLIGLTVSIHACKNGNKDSVEKADSANKAHLDSPATGTPTVMTDEESSSFFVNAANEGMTEVQLGEMAREKGMEPKTRSFAAALAREHADMINEVKKYSAQRNVVLPEAITPDNRKKIDELSLKPRKEFDQAYLDVVIKDHESAISMYTKAGDLVNDTDVKNFINNSIPKLKNHLDSARAMRRSLK